MAKIPGLFCFVPYKMGIIPFSNDISWILVLSPLFSFLYIKFMKNCSCDAFWSSLWNFSEGKITNFWYFWNNCLINFKMVYRFQYISTLLLIKIWFSLWTKKFFIFPQPGKNSRLFKLFEFGNRSRTSDEKFVILEFKYLHNKKW